MDNTREKLIELIGSTEYGSGSLIGKNFQEGFIAKIADHLIASGFIEELQNEAYDLGVDSALHNHFGLSWEDAADLRKEVTRLQNATKWIPVTERLPNGEELVMIHCKNGAMFVGYCGKQYADYERRWRIKTALNSTKLLNLGRVTHWMPLPEAPTE